MLLASSTQVAVGWVIAVLVGIGFVAYLIANLRAAKPELGSEIELAANRKPYFDDMELETSRLDRSLVFALSMLAIVAVALPVYWLAEPARITNAQEGFTIRSEKRARRSMPRTASAATARAPPVASTPPRSPTTPARSWPT